MSGYSRKLVSLEITLKEIIKDLKADALKEITGKSESHFRKCSDENDTQDIHHIDSIKIDIECLKRGLGNPMLSAHEDMLESTSPEYKNLDNVSNTLINIGAKIGKLMETTQKATSPKGEGGSKISESEKKHISKALNDVEDKILELKLIIERSNKLSEIK
ncbi:hypothetical protein PB7211_595 [Candidatus Pelagibacter sp. HTCC7211]|uniref:hypothetical protein n=1 Tax=Pelagibacter sp. (strain HTCC7211) TaxID=439493 RepID=UPI000183A539|nr:hypothetical protein [Candidatus Pelagibacter sp. HTCC7211]EDZ60272.1 hypothetical protein PB7211_595 [Candidatus Pelagibacter sp. HTCC7211]|tara:strand:- start:336 stop:818 length:483 start_codon:yes stop_codon:yes gene_type:complete